MSICMVTTSDNIYDYFEEFDKWYTFDTQKGYNTLSYLARLVRLYEDQSIEDQDAEIERAVDEIVGLNLTGNYIKVYPRESKEEPSDSTS